MFICIRKKGIYLKREYCACAEDCFFLIVLWAVFHKNYEEIYLNIQSVKIQGLILILMLGISYQLFEAEAFYLLVKRNSPKFTFLQSLGSIYVGIFGNVAAFSIGAVPMRTYYLHKYQIDVGKTVGLINADYILHKSAVLICNTCLLAFCGTEILKERKTLVPYILFGYAICVFIIVLLLLIGFSKKIYGWIQALIMKIPERKKGRVIKEKLLYHLAQMRQSSEEIRNQGKNIVFVMILHCVKLLIMYMIPFVCVKSMTGEALSFFEMQLLSALTNLIANALPSVSGMGAAELAFFIVFEDFVNGVSTASILLLYRLATYFVPFIISIVVLNNVGQYRDREKIGIKEKS